jgi:Domain of unknown function (DUF4157)
MRALATKPPAAAASTRFAAASRGVHASVRDALRAPGRPLAQRDRSAFESRFGHEFGRVRIHDDAAAASSAAKLNAAAYTVGGDIVFGTERYDPGTAAGRELLAHELAHVVQQDGGTAAAAPDEMTVEPPDGALEREAHGAAAATITGGRASVRSRGFGTGTRVMRADPDAVAQVRKLGTVVGAGIQFVPTNVTDTRIGPVSVGGGLQNPGASRLNVIVGENLTPRILARELLPLWTTATPFTPPSGGPAVPPGPLTEQQLAQGLLVYNQYYLVLPAMPNWRAGLRLPLPVEIDEVTGVATVNADVIRSLAASFDPAWMPALDQRAVSSAAQPAATVRADATAFLAGEPTARGRGVMLAARALTNAQVGLPLIREVFTQLGAGGVEVALAMMDELVNRDVSVLAAQRDGAAILAILQGALAGGPAGLTPDQLASLVRANAMFGRVAGAAASAPSAAVPTRAEKSVTVDTVQLVGSSFTPATQVAVANAIYAQCNVRFAHGVDATASAAQSSGWLGADNAISVASVCGSVVPEQRALYRSARAAFGFGARIQAFFVPTITGYNASAFSLPRYCATGAAAPFRDTVIIENSGDDSTLAHEIGHILLNAGGHPAATLMAPRPRPNEITDAQCRTIYNNA